jgi:L-fuculose-phosphate aldolase
VKGEHDARAALIEALRALERRGLNRGSTGNGSVRWAHDGRPGMLITPTGMAAGELRPDNLSWVGDDGERRGDWQPSSEWAFHQAVYRARPEAGAVLHTHAVHATALGCVGRRLPPFHYMVAVAGGHDVPLVPYHTFGSAALSDAVGAAMRERWACLLAQHGLVSAGRDVAQALKVMVEIESLCRTYLLALGAGEPALLSAAEMDTVLAKFAGYGRSARQPTG